MRSHVTMSAKLSFILCLYLSDVFYHSVKACPDDRVSYSLISVS